MSLSPSGWVAPPVILVEIVIVAVYAGLLALVLGVARVLRRDPDWSLAAALSEEAELTEAGGCKTVLAASTSRLIAFLGMVVILVLFMAYGAFVLWGVAMTGNPPAGSGEFSKYLLGGVTLFAPYVVNKFACVFAAR